MYAKIPFLIITLLLSNYFFGQISGNQIYKDKNNNYYRNENTTSINTNPNITINDSMLFISTKVVLNQKADQFMITLGVNEESKSSISCDNQINNRISDLISFVAFLSCAIPFPRLRAITGILSVPKSIKAIKMMNINSPPPIPNIVLNFTVQSYKLN